MHRDWYPALALLQDLNQVTQVSVRQKSGMGIQNVGRHTEFIQSQARLSPLQIDLYSSDKGEIDEQVLGS
jgi:hypothetical protein